MTQDKSDLTLPELLERLAPVAYPTLREFYRHDCCIAAAAILIRVFEHYGFEANAIPVTLQIYNAPMVKLLMNEAPLPEDPDRRAKLFELTGAWGIGVVPAASTLATLNGVPGGGYGGHLLVRVKEFLIDATLAQATRPDKQIVLPQLLATPHAFELLNSNAVSLEVNGCAVVYRLSSDETYLEAPDWKRRTFPVPETLKRILIRLEASE